MAKKQKSLASSNRKKHTAFRKGKSHSSTNPQRKVKGNTSGANNSLRTKSTIKRLKMYNQKMPNSDKLNERSTEQVRVDPNRKWFGNVRTIDQKALEKLRIQMMNKQSDPNKIFLKSKKVPLTLLNDPTRQNKVRLLEVETYQDTFGPKSRRKKAKLTTNTLEELAIEVEAKEHNLEKDCNIVLEDDEERLENRNKKMTAGQSRRIWEELHKVIDCSDVIVQVLDARDPMGTRSLALEEHIKSNYPHKHIALLLNKADLIPVWVTAKWSKALSKQYPTIAYRASITNPFGKGSLINLFRQFDIFHHDKKNISIGFVGYPNVGKSSVINSLKEKKVCKAAPVPGETKVWQYITLTKRIYLIDCPGTVHATEGKDDVEAVLKGCIRAERIDCPTYYIPHLMARLGKKEFLSKKYGIPEWEDSQDFLKRCAIKKGKLKKGGQPDVDAVAKIILIDWQRGELPFYSLPEGEIDKLETKGGYMQSTLDQVKEEDFMAEVGGATMANLVVKDTENK